MMLTTCTRPTTGKQMELVQFDSHVEAKSVILLRQHHDLYQPVMYDIDQFIRSNLDWYANTPSFSIFTVHEACRLVVACVSLSRITVHPFVPQLLLSVAAGDPVDGPGIVQVDLINERAPQRDRGIV